MSYTPLLFTGPVSPAGRASSSGIIKSKKAFVNLSVTVPVRNPFCQRKPRKNSPRGFLCGAVIMYDAIITNKLPNEKA